MRKYLLPEGGQFYKANMHVHTKVSDGSLTPEEVKEAYLKEGYSIVAFTDHEVIVPQNQLTDENFLAITGYEISIIDCAPGKPFQYVDVYHLNLYAEDPNNDISSAFRMNSVWLKNSHVYVTEEMKKYDYPRRFTVECANEVVRNAKEEGFFVCLNHPSWSVHSYKDYAGIDGLWGVEVFNTGGMHSGFLDNTQAFEDLLRLGKNVFPIAADDAHSINDAFGGWIMVKAEDLKYATVIEALKRGDFYASTGPEIFELSLEDGKLSVKTSEALGIYVMTERRVTRSVNATEEAPITEAVFDISQYLADSVPEKLLKRPYIRVYVRDAKGGFAWSRAYFLDELEEYKNVWRKEQ